MADKKISALTALTAANVAPATDVVPIVDTSATETKKITAKDLVDGALNGGTANGVLYLNGSKAATSGSALTFDGTNLGIGVTLSAWRSGARALQSGAAGYVSLWEQANGSTNLSFAAYESASNTFAYRTTGDAPTLYSQLSGAHLWFNAASGTAGNTFSFTERMRLDSSGNLGIGTSSPGAKLDVYGGASGTVTNFQIGNAATGFQFGIDSSNSCQIRTAQSVPIIFYTNNTERARITAAGDLLIGTTGARAGELVSITKNMTTNWLLETVNTATSGNIFGNLVLFSGQSPNNATSKFMAGSDSTTERFALRSNGGLANYQSNNADLSDIRTKTDINPAASMWGKIGALEIVTYKYNDQMHDDVNVGVIAQQVEAVEPVWVDTDGFGATPEDGVPLKTVYTKDITFAAIKALQEAMSRIEQLEAKVAALENNA